MQKRRIFILLTVLLVTSLACGFSKAATDATQEDVPGELPATQKILAKYLS